LARVGIQMNRSFWRGKRVLVTGHTGFKGSWLTAWLLKMQADVAGFALEPDTKPSLFEELELSSQIRHHKGDVRSLDQLRRVFRSFRPEIVFHLAAQPLVRTSYENPVLTYETNVLGTVNLFEAIRGSGSARAVVNVTTDKVYANDERGRGFAEDEPLGGHDPYSTSKACSELVTQSYRDSFLAVGGAGRRAINVATARSGNVIGGGDWSRDRLIPDLVRAISKGHKALVRNPDAIRPWQHVVEALHGYLLLAESLWKNQQGADQAWNFGPPARLSKTVHWMADRFCVSWGGNSAWQVDERVHPFEAKLLKLDSKKAERVLKWRCLLSLDKTVEWTAEWYRRWSERAPLLETTLEQLSAYEEIVKAAKP